MVKSRKKVVLSHLIAGVIFGVIFPLTSILREISIYELPFSIESIITLHRNNLQLYIIDTAPIFLGIFSLISGLYHSKSISIYNILLQQKNELEKSKKELTKSKKIIEEKNLILYNDSIIDNLTGLKKENLLISESLGKSNITLCILNINHFREINNIFGYDAGDYILLELASILLEHDFNCYKLDNDEFAIIYEKHAYSSELAIFSNYLFETIINSTFIFNDHEIFLTISLGIAHSKESIKSKDDILNLLFNAGYALKHAKNNHLVYSIYNTKLAEHLENTDNFNWKHKIINSLRNNRVTAVYQAIFDNNTMKAVKYETLIRIKEENGELISPGNFLIPARKYRLYNYLTREVFSHALQQIEDHNCEISVNISINDIREFTTKKFIISKLKNFEKTNKIVFELLESEGIENYDEVKAFIKQVKSYGCKIALDDFGSGYSNFSHILNLNIDYIKLDASIIKNIHKDKNSEYIAKLIVDFAKTINVETVAEFVHSKEVLNKVIELGIDYSQGFYLGKPESDIK